MAVNRKKLMTTTIKLLVSVAAIYYVIQKVDFESVKGVFIQGKPAFIFLGFLCLIISQIISSDRLRTILTAHSLDVDRVWNYKLYFVGMAYNLFLPGGIGGDAYKVIVYNKRFQTGKRKLALSLLLDRLTGLLAIVIILALLSWGIGLDWPLINIYWLAIPLGLAIAWIVCKYFFPIYLPVIWKAELISLVIQSMQVICIIFLAKGFSFEASLIQIAFIFLMSTLATAIPVFAGGIGAREIVFGLVAVELALSEPVAVTVGLSFSMITVLASLPGLYFDWTIKNANKSND